MSESLNQTSLDADQSPGGASYYVPPFVKTFKLDQAVRSESDLKEALKNNWVNLDSCNSEGQTLLHRAVQRHPKDSDMVRNLLKIGADPNKCDNNGVSPFTYDALHGKAHFKDWCDWCRDKKGELHLPSDRQRSGKVMFCIVGTPRTSYDVVILKAIPKQEIEAIRQESDQLGRTPLFYTIESTSCQHKYSKYSIDLFNILYQLGYELDHTDKNGQNIFHRIGFNRDFYTPGRGVVFEDQGMVNMVKTAMCQKDREGNMPIHLAAESQNALAFVKFKEYLGNITELNDRSQTGLMLLCKNIHCPEVLREVLDRLSRQNELSLKDYINAVDNNGHSALSYLILFMTSRNSSHSAVQKAITLLSNHGLDIDMGNPDGMSPIQLAVNSKSFGAIRFFEGSGGVKIIP